MAIIWLLIFSNTHLKTQWRVRAQLAISVLRNLVHGVNKSPPHHGFYCINIISTTLAPLFYNRLSCTESGYSDLIYNCSPLFSVLKPPAITLSSQFPKNPHTKYFLAEYYSTNPHGFMAGFLPSFLPSIFLLRYYQDLSWHIFRTEPDRILPLAPIFFYHIWYLTQEHILVLSFQREYEIQGFGLYCLLQYSLVERANENVGEKNCVI